MTTVITAANKAGVDVLNTIGSVATSATKLVSNLTSSVDMLDLFITTQLTKQRVNAKLEIERFIEETSLTESERQQKIITRLSTDQDFKNLYQTNETKIRAIIALNPS